MSCSSPSAPCKCCVESKPCCYELQLSAKDHGRITWLMQWLSDDPRKTDLRTRATIEELHKADVEPMTGGSCPSCRATMKIATYLVYFLKLRAAEWPKCVACAAGVRSAA